MPLLGICPKDCIPHYRCTCSSLFIDASFRIARNWKLHRCLATDNWITKVWYIYKWNIIHLLKNEILRPGDNHPEWGSPDPEIKMSQVLSHKWMLPLSLDMHISIWKSWEVKKNNEPSWVLRGDFRGGGRMQRHGGERGIIDRLCGRGGRVGKRREDGDV